MRIRSTFVLLVAGAALTAGACAWDDYSYGAGPHPYGRTAYHGDAWRTRAPYRGDLRGPGVATLDPWLRDTREGRAIVTLGFRGAAGGYVSAAVANRANVWFRDYADTNRDRTITDAEIRTALVAAAGRYLPAGG